MTIAEYIEERGLTHDSFAKRIGKTRKAVGHWVIGIRRPLPHTAMKIQRITKAWVRGGETDGLYGANISMVFDVPILGVYLSRGRCRRRFFDWEYLLRH
jgi:hypothetical protein